MNHWRRLGWMMFLFGCGGPAADERCSDLDGTPHIASFAEVDVFTECYSLSVCENGAFDWSESLSEEWSSYQFNSRGETTYMDTRSDGDDGTPCSTRWSVGRSRSPCTDSRIARGCVVPYAPRVAVDEPLGDLVVVPTTLADAQTVGGCTASAVCVGESGVVLEVRSGRLFDGVSAPLPVAAQSSLGMYDIASGDLWTTAHLVGPSVFAGESETGWLYWEGPEETSCLDAVFSLTVACGATLGVPDAVEQARIGR